MMIIVAAFNFSIIGHPRDSWLGWYLRKLILGHWIGLLMMTLPEAMTI